MKRSIVIPLLYGVILFLLIRLANDLPMRANYLQHTWSFIVIELTGVAAGCFICHGFYRKWMRISVQKDLSIFLEYAIVILFPAAIALSVMALSHDVPLWSELPELVIPIIITVLMSIWLYQTEKSHLLYTLYCESRIHRQEMQQKKTETELKLLRAQFHPHFLFNMLNTIYFTIEEGNATARRAVEHLSTLLRAQLYEGDGKVSLEREVSAIKSYLELCRLRFGDSLDIKTDFGYEDTDAEIHPHLLLPLVENAVKHSGGSPRQIMVRLDYGDRMLSLTVENTLSTGKTYPKEDSGLGLSNLRKRLTLLYQSKYELNIGEKGDIFLATLKLTLSD